VLIVLHTAHYISYYYAMASQNIVQKMPFPSTTKRYVQVMRRYHKHLHDGTKSDAVSGWLLYASCYYVLGEYRYKRQHHFQ
jgi:hypothetical protein